MRAQFDSLPVRTRTLCGVLLVSYVLCRLLPFLGNLLAMAPGLTIPPNFYVWNVLTAGFIELHLPSVVFHCALLLLMGPKLEPMWGSVEFVRFVTVTNVLTNLFTLAVMIFVYPMSNQERWLTSRFAGFAAGAAGLTVALKQLFPDQEFGLDQPKLGVRAKHFPLMLLSLHIVLFVLKFPFHNLLYTFFGIMVSWTYLRFYQVKISDGTRKVVGDMNESFSFSSFFPEKAAPFVQVLANTVFAVFKACNCCKNVDMSQDAPRTQNSDGDAERRRAKALRSLDQRIQEQEFHVQAQADITSPHQSPAVV